MAIIEALKKLGKSLLGDKYTPTEAKTDSQIAETIEGISKAIDDAGGIGGGGSSLPMIVTATVNANPRNPSEYSVTFGNTWQEIADAFNAGSVVLVENTWNDYNIYTAVCGISVTSDNFYCVIVPWLDNTYGYYSNIVFSSPDTDGLLSYSTV